MGDPERHALLQKCQPSSRGQKHLSINGTLGTRKREEGLDTKAKVAVVGVSKEVWYQWVWL